MPSRPSRPRSSPVLPSGWWGSITEAEKKIKAFADGHKTRNFSCVTPAEADRILRQFYGLPEPEATPAPEPAPSRQRKMVDLADFL